MPGHLEKGEESKLVPKNGGHHVEDQGKNRRMAEKQIQKGPFFSPPFI